MWHRRTAAEKAKDVAHLATFYWSRLIATAGCWFFWDFGFYGNKVFQSQFVKIITGGGAVCLQPKKCLPRISGLCVDALELRLLAQPQGTLHDSACLDNKLMEDMLRSYRTSTRLTLADAVPTYVRSQRHHLDPGLDAAQLRCRPVRLLRLCVAD